MTKSAFERIAPMLAHIDHVQRCQQMLYMVDYVAKSRDDKQYNEAYEKVHAALMFKWQA